MSISEYSKRHTAMRLNIAAEILRTDILQGLSDEDREKFFRLHDDIYALRNKLYEDLQIEKEKQ